MKRMNKTIEKVCPVSVYRMMSRYMGEMDRRFTQGGKNRICFTQDDVRIYVENITPDEIGNEFSGVIGCRMLVYQTGKALSNYTQYKIAKAFISKYFNYKKDHNFLNYDKMTRDRKIIRNIRRNK